MSKLYNLYVAVSWFQTSLTAPAMDWYSTSVVLVKNKVFLVGAKPDLVNHFKKSAF